MNATGSLSFKLPLCWLHSLTPVTWFAMLPGIRSLAVAIHLEIHRVYSHFVVENIFMGIKLAILLRINRESYV
ncbi:hypothetical protein SAMN02982990_03346 [Photorhabdus luminescens]|uniref:Uncharacterized protein n=1 Tax=Photorhabdus luminescens TaxID=29488 RepID=A0A1G5R7Q8_PHOLU|nr:hypothetical protein SAMN02982990_03346 [Photorhabdus luminescens]